MMKRNRILIVAPAFPPHPSPATHRSRFLATYASEFGWDAEVLAVDPRYYVEPPDRELFSLVPRELAITYSSAWRSGWTRRFGVGDLGMRAYYPMRRTLRQICRDRRPDIVFLSGGPFHTFLLGADALHEFGVPYVLDYTDPWIDPPRPEHSDPRRKIYWARRLAERLEPRAVRDASHIFAVSDRTHDGVRARHPEIPESRYSALPIGFDEHDFEALRGRPGKKQYWDATDGRLHFVYVGAVSVTMQPVVRALLSAVRTAAESTPALRDAIRLHFIGTSYDPSAGRGVVAPIAADEGVAHLVTEHPRRIPYVDALGGLTSADAILGLGSMDRHYQASKIFNCILAKRPILGVYHEESGVCEVLRTTPRAELVTFGDVGPTTDTQVAIGSALATIALGGSVTRQLSPPDLRPYSARAMTGRMLSVCDEILGTSMLPAQSNEYQHA